MKKLSILSLAIISIIAAFWLADGETIAAIDQPPALPQASDKAQAVYQNLRVADMHADSLIWNRDLSQRSNQGLVDIPRLIENRVALQVFMAAIDAPNDVISNNIPAQGDQLLPLVIVDTWPIKTWLDHHQRALHVAQRLHRYQAATANSFSIIKNKQDLTRYLAKAQQQPKQTAGILGIEGAAATNGQVHLIDSLFNAGFRSMSLAHYTDDVFAGSSSGMQKPGLSALGQQAVKRMEALGMIIDVAHVSEPAIQQVLAMASRPVFASHVGVKASCPSARNLSDGIMRAIAAQGGIIGIGFFKEAICSNDISGVVTAIMHAYSIVGAKHVALGSGFDVSPMPLALSDLPLLVERLLQQGLSKTEVADIMGENVLRFFMEALPNA